MTSLESRIYADADAAAGEITPADIPPLRLPAARGRKPGGPGLDRAGRPMGARFWLAPLAAAASVIAITATMLVVARTDSGSQAPSGPARPAASSHPATRPADDALGPEALDYFFPATGAQYTAGLAYAWAREKARAPVFAECMALAGYPQPPFTEPEQIYLQSFPDNSQFPDLAQLARTGTMIGLSYATKSGLPNFTAGLSVTRSCEARADQAFAAVDKAAAPLQNQWLTMVDAVQTSARVAAMQPDFAACLEARGVPAYYAEQQRPTASNPLFTGLFSWMDHLGQTVSTRRMASQERHWTLVFVKCAGPTVNLMQRLQLAERARFFKHYARQIAMIGTLAKQLPGAGR